MEPIKGLIYGLGITFFVVILAKLFTKENPDITKPDKIFDIGMTFIIWSMIIFFIFIIIIGIYGLIVADPNSKYPTLQPWVNLRELYIGPFKTSWEN